MSVQRIDSKYRPIQYIKVNQKLAIPSGLKKGRNIILSRNIDDVNEDSIIYLGKVLEHTLPPDIFSFNVWLDIDYPYVILIPGRRGTGKSYTLGVFAEGLAFTREDTNITTKNTRHTSIVIDTLGQFWQMGYKPEGNNEEEKKQLSLLEEWGLAPNKISNIQVYVPYGRKSREEWKEFQIKFNEVNIVEIAGVLNLDIYQDRMGQLLNHVYYRVREEGYIKGIINEITGELRRSVKVEPTSVYDIDDFIDCINNDIDILSPHTGFHIQTRRALRSRLLDMKRWNIFSSEGIIISDIYKQNFLTILNLEGVDEDFRNLIVGVLVRKIFQAREKTRRAEKIREMGESGDGGEDEIPPGWLIIDEAHEYCPSSGITASKSILIKYAKEGRSLGLGLIMATQQPSALASQISSQAEIVISHALAFMTDIRALNDRLVNRVVPEYQGRNETYSWQEQLRLLKPGSAIVSVLQVPRIFLMEIRPRLTIHGGVVPKME